MGILDVIRDVFGHPPDRSQAQDEEREAIKSEVSRLAHEREAQDARISGFRQQADAALRGYRPGLLDPLQEARENLGRPIERGGNP